MRNRERVGAAASPAPERDSWNTAGPFGAGTLPGTVSDAAQRLEAREAARCIAQILDVTNDREAVPLAGSGCAEADVARAIHAALEWDVLVARAVHDL